MKKIELLVPAGNFEAFRAAVFNGADAVYIGGKNFGARAFANNFDHEELIQAVKLAHLYGVKVYVTMNIFAWDEKYEE
ncbi:MAG: peptidase U32 family protein, partial [Erysipelotrichaceae bacterium]